MSVGLPLQLAGKFAATRSVHPPSVAGNLIGMRYLVRARVKPGCQRALLEAIDLGTLGEGSVAEGEYLRNMNDARLCPDQSVR